MASTQEFKTQIVLPADPTANLQAATKQYADTKGVIVGTDPSTAPNGSLFYDTDAPSPLLETTGTGSPEGVVFSAPGGVWKQTDDATFGYLKWFKATGTGATGWLPDFEGRWKTWSAVLVQGVTPTQTLNWARYTQTGKTIIVSAFITATGNGTSGSKIQVTGLPLNINSSAVGVGSYRFFDSGVNNWVGTVIPSGASAVEFAQDANGNYLGVGIQVNSGDYMHFMFTYEAA